MAIAAAFTVIWVVAALVLRRVLHAQEELDEELQAR